MLSKVIETLNILKLVSEFLPPCPSLPSRWNYDGSLVPDISLRNPFKGHEIRIFDGETGCLFVLQWRDKQNSREFNSRILSHSKRLLGRYQCFKNKSTYQSTSNSIRNTATDFTSPSPRPRTLYSLAQQMAYLASRFPGDLKELTTPFPMRTVVPLPRIMVWREPRLVSPKHAILS